MCGQGIGMRRKRIRGRQNLNGERRVKRRTVLCENHKAKCVKKDLNFTVSSKQDAELQFIFECKEVELN